MTEIKITVEGINNRLDDKEAWIGELEDRVGEIIQAEKKKRIFKISIVWDLLDNNECTDIGILGIPEKEESKCYFFLFEEIIVEIFPKLGKEIDIQVQEYRQSQTRWSQRSPHQDTL